jgi:serine O-acetyltransferase
MRIELEKNIPSRPQSVWQCFTYDNHGQGIHVWQAVIRFLFVPGYNAVVSYRLTQFFRHPTLKLLRLLVQRYSRKYSGAEIHPESRIGPGLELPHPNGVVIGAGVIIGEDVTIYQQVALGGRGKDGFKASSSDYPQIGSLVTVYAGAKILGAIRIGSGSQVGANAVVLKDVPANSTAVGVPARIIYSELMR